MQTAEDISKALLHETGLALMSGDFQQFVACFRLPQDVETETGRLTVTKPEDLQLVFERVRWHYRAKGVTKLDRRCVSAAFLNPSTILSTHETRMLRGPYLVQAPFRALSEISRDEGVWRIAGCGYDIEDSQSHNRALSG